MCLSRAWPWGVPVVATGISAIPEIVENEKTGLLVPPGRPETLARAAHRLLTDTDLRKRIIPAASLRVKTHFDNRQLIEKLGRNLPGPRGIGLRSTSA